MAQAVAMASDLKTGARSGDLLVVKSNRVGAPERVGLILEVRGQHGEPPYLVRWEDGHEALIYPGTDATVKHKKSRKADR